MANRPHIFRHIRFLSFKFQVLSFYIKTAMSIAQEFDFLLQWHLTEKCNLRCRHCYQQGGGAEEMTKAEIFRVIDAAVRMVRDWEEAYELKFSPSFNVTGGEPFLRPDFWEILAQMGETPFEVYILSNGTLITSEMARKVASLGVKGVQVSLEGPEKVHEEIRGQGSFEAAVEGINNLLDAGVPVSLNTTLSRLNAPFFPELVDLAVSWGVPRLGFSRLVPYGRGLTLGHQSLSIREVKDFYEKFLFLKVPGLTITSGDPVASQLRSPPPEDDLEDIPLGGCAAGVSGLTLLPNGNVIPCRRLPVPLGNVRKESLRELWAASPVLERLRDRSQYHGKCGRCRRWANCRGCRAIAYAYSLAKGTPDFLAEDPQCFIED
jgi:radical SAM protein with 4Fe4S-binding SPASM domain